MKIKQNLGSVYAVAGTPEEINPLFLSLFNWNGLATTAKILNEGSPETFVYFLITEESYILARSHCFVCQISSGLDKGKERGNWQAAQSMARREWDGISYEKFLFFDTSFEIEAFKVEDHEYYYSLKI